ncbi:hypothetical protein GCM10027199_58740 [Amycolatopsis magusensis]
MAMASAPAQLDEPVDQPGADLPGLAQWEGFGSRDRVVPVQEAERGGARVRSLSRKRASNRVRGAGRPCWAPSVPECVRHARARSPSAATMGSTSAAVVPRIPATAGILGSRPSERHS